MKAVILDGSTAYLVHLFSEWCAIAVGVQLYRRQRARAGQASILQPGHYAVMIGCILGAAIGNKLVFWLEFPPLWTSSWNVISIWASGQSIVGGLLGGLIGVELTKKWNGITNSTGDYFVLPLIVGTVIGRMGCFLAGLHDGTYGNPTQLPWGIDFGDGIPRHPTQLYEILFVLLLGTGLIMSKKRWQVTPGLLFKLYLSGYLAWRLWVDSIKPLPFDYGYCLSGIQCVCLLALLCYLPFVVKQFLSAKRLRDLPLPLN
jgi:phosphatidylglycerol:prolipoprotein diacylglycerol transferase